MSDANPTSEAGAGAEALLGLAAQAGQAVRLPSLPSIAKQPSSTHAPFLPAPPSLALPTQPQSLQPQSLSQPQPQPQPQQPPPQTLQTLQTQHPAAPLQPSQAPLPPPPGITRERLPTLSEWADPAFRPFPPPLLAPLPDRWQSSAPVPPPPSQYPYHNPWQSYPYPPPYYYYQQQNMSYPVPHQPSVAPVPPPLALPSRPVVPPLRVPLHTDPVRDAAATNESAAFPPIPQPRTAINRDPLLERLTSEAAAAPKKTPSRARGLADLMNPTDTVPGSSAGLGQSRMDVPLIKPESIEKHVTPVTIPSVPSAEPKLSDIVKDQLQPGKLDLAVIADASTDIPLKDAPQKIEPVAREEKEQEGPAEDNGRKEEEQVGHRISPDRRQSHENREMKIMEEKHVPLPSSEEEQKPEKVTTEAVPKEDEDRREKIDESVSEPDLLEDEDEGMNKEKEDGENGDEETRCPCGSTANSGTMIACDQCNTWQHSRCMGFRRSSEVPEKYYCHICRPDEIRPNCVAHSKQKDRSSRERNSLDRRDFETQLAAVKPVELRKIFVSDMRHKKTMMRSKPDVFLRYAGHLKNQYGKHRTSIIDGLMILLDMQRQDVTEKLDVAMKRLKTEKQEDVERKRSGTTTSYEGPPSEIGGTRTPGSSRVHTQKRARPHSLSMDGSEATSGVRGECTEALGDFDLGADAMHGRNMSREERKLQQTMKLFARMEEREREKKKPRTGDVGASPRAGPPSRSRTPKPSSARTASPKSSAMAMDSDEASRKAASEARQNMGRTDSPELTKGPTSETRSSDMPRQNQQQEDISQPKIVQPLPQQKTSLTSRSENEISKKDREQRRERLERTAPKRKESSSPDNLNGNANGRRRNILARERSQDGKRRRVGVSREPERRNSSSKEPQEIDPSLEFSVTLPGPSVIGSKKIAKSRLSTLDREIRENEEKVTRRKQEQVPSNGNKKEQLLEDARQEAMKKLLNGGKSPSPMKKRYRLGDELREEESNVDASEEQKEFVQSPVEPSVNGKASETLSVSMVVVSEKGSLPDRGQILESTRLILPGANGKLEDATTGKADTVQRVCLKKRPIMLTAPSSERNGSEDQEVSLKPNTAEEAPPKQSTPLKLSSPLSPSPRKAPSSPSTEKSPSSPLQRVASPKLRSCPPPILRSPSFRSVPANEWRQPARSPSPLPSFKSQKLSPSVQKRRSQSPEAEKNLREEIPRKYSSVSSPAHSADERPRRTAPDSSDANGPIGKTPKGSEESAQNVSGSKTIPDTKSTQTSAAPPLLRSIRSVPPPVPKKVEPSSAVKTQTTGKEGHNEGTTGDSGQPSVGKHSSGGATISDIFQQRVQGFLRPSGASPSPSPRGPGPRYWLASPLSSPRAGASHLNVEASAPSVRGSTAKLGAAMPLSSKPNLDGLRNSNGLSPRVSGSGHAYSRSYGPSFRSKPADADRSWNSVPSFSSLKRQHGFGRGSRGSSFIGGKPGSFAGVDRGRHGHGRDGLAPYGRDDMMDKTRSGYRRDGHFAVSRDDDKVQGGNPHSWGRSYPQRNGWGGSGPGHHSSGDGSGRGSRRGHHGS